MIKSIEDYAALRIGLTQKDLKNQAAQKKQQLIDYAKHLSGFVGLGTFDYHWIWVSKDLAYKVGVGKYGKEYYSTTIKYKDGNRGNNPNDMNPSIMKDGNIIRFDSSFGHVFKFFEDLHSISPNACELLGYLMVRNAFLCDHSCIGGYQYTPPQEIIDAIEEDMYEFDGISVEAYIHYIDMIAWNEDVKYSTLGYDVLKSGYGRLNNVLTYAHFIAVLLRKTSLYKICSNFARVPVGVSPLLRAEINEVYPFLDLK